MRRAAAVALALGALAGCGGDDAPPEPAATPGHSPALEGSERAARGDPDTRRERSGGREPSGEGAEHPRCPPATANCRSAAGRILYVERVDPDGDGDAHFVLLSRESVTAPGISVIDVARELRPDPLPGPGQTLSAAGPVYRGSHGQRQIQATEVAVGG